MTWEAFHHRGDVLRAVIAEAGNRRDGTLPMDLPGVRETFRDELDLLASLQLRWHTRLAGRIERELAAQPMDLEQAVITAWRATARELVGVREIIDHHREHPTDDEMVRVMTVSAAKERQMLALMAGLVSTMALDEHGARLGARVEEAARAGLVAPPRDTSSTDTTVGNASFLDRLRAALAA
jgi:hypothetical protein